MDLFKRLLGSLIETNTNIDTIKYLAEELNMSNINLKKVDGIIPPDIVDNYNEYIEKVKPVIKIGIDSFKLTALLSKITKDDNSYDEEIKAGGESIPEIFILKNILLPIRNQGETNCCVAFATSCAIEYKNIMNKVYLDYLSPAFIYNNRYDPTKDDGLDSKDAINIVKKYGVATEKIYPFENLNQTIQPYIYDDAKKYSIISSFYIKEINILKIAIFKNGPVIAILPVYLDADPNTFWQRKYASTYSGFHCIAFVGYDNVNQRFLIRNSWGTKWGLNGYQWFPYSDYNIIVEAWTLLPSTINPSETIYSQLDLNVESTSDDEIFGINKLVFYSLLAGMIIFIIIIIIIIIIRYKKINSIKSLSNT